MQQIGAGTAFAIFLFLASLNFFIVGVTDVPPKGDAEDYNAYAVNIASGGGYSLDGTTFSPYREPGYPLFVSSIYRVFGIQNFLAVKLAQVFLVAAAAYFLLLSFRLFNIGRPGIVAGALFALLPQYSYYANLLLSETLFTFFLMASLYLSVKILRNGSGWQSYALLGGVLGVTALTRSHMLFFPGALALLLIFFHKPAKQILLFLSVFALLIGLWAGYVYRHTGNFMITAGRAELHLYARAVRSQLSYADSLRYLSSWIFRSKEGGTTYRMLELYEPKPLAKQFAQELSKGKTVADIRRESTAILIKNPGHYLFGNVIEWVKLMFVEHLFPPVSPLLTRSVRLIIYVLLYLSFIGGIAGVMFSKNKELKLFAGIAGLYLFYHWAVLTFFDVVPRFNTPYFGLYLLIGVAGLGDVLYNRYHRA